MSIEILRLQDLEIEPLVLNLVAAEVLRAGGRKRSQARRQADSKKHQKRNGAIMKLHTQSPAAPAAARLVRRDR